MIAPALVLSALASAVAAWGVPPSFVLSSQQPAHVGDLFGPDTAFVPRSRVHGAGSKEIVSRIIRSHIDEVKACYDAELSREPTLAGKINVQFTIEASGQVSEASVARSTLHNARVESCTVEAVRRWPFPKPLGGGKVIISYPFVMETEPIEFDAGAEGEGKGGNEATAAKKK